MSEAKQTQRTVAVIYGGRSSEHSISCVSAGAVMKHLVEKYNVVPVAITPEGRWVPGKNSPDELALNGPELPTVTNEGPTIQLDINPEHAGRLIYSTGDQAGETFADIDVVLPILHGRFGEDGTIQGLCEMAGVPYVGAGVACSAVSMDKELTKKMAAAEGLPTGRQVIMRDERDLTESEKALLGLPVFVKPARGGSSIGISKVDRWEDMSDALALAREHDSKSIVEAMIIGREVECGVLQHPDGTVTASVPALLADTEAGDEGFYGFDTKYLDNVVSAAIPAPLPDGIVEQIQLLAIETFRAMNGEGLSRVDFFITDEGPVLNEINTMPGFTPISMYPQMFEATGISYSSLLEILIERALVAGIR